MGKKRKSKGKKVKHVKYWRSKKPYNRGVQKIVRGKYIKKVKEEVE